MSPAQRRGGPTPIAVGVFDEPELIVCGISSMLAQQRTPADVRLVETGLLGDAPSAFEVDVVICDPIGRALAVDEYLAQVIAITVAPVIAFTWSTSPSHVRRALAAGASGFVSKATSAADLVAAVHAVHDGQKVTPAASTLPIASGLSQRETEVLDLICRGLSNLEIADQLYVSVNSIKTYVRQVYQKIGVSRRSQAVAWGLAHGF